MTAAMKTNAFECHRRKHHESFQLIDRMITSEQIIEIGKFGKPHGINGEISAFIDDDVDIEAIDRIVMDVDGIYVPFFIDSLRPKRTETVLIKIDGIDDERHAARLTNRIIYALKKDDVKVAPDHDDDGFYASDLIGYTIVHANGEPVGTITDIEDSTENALFVINRPDEQPAYIPIADELIDEINPEERYIVMTLPEGILDL